MGKSTLTTNIYENNVEERGNASRKNYSLLKNQGWSKSLVFDHSLLPVQSNPSYLYFSSNEETGDAYELQRWFEHVSLCGHEAIKVVLSMVVCLPVQFVHFTHLKCQNKHSRFAYVRELWTLKRHQEVLNNDGTCTPSGEACLKKKLCCQ